MDYLDRAMLHGNAETLVLAILADRPCHGYEIRKELVTRSNECFQFAFGRLYPLLRSLERRGLVTARRERSHLNRKCNTYALTGSGTAALRIRKTRWRQFSTAMDRVLSRS